SSVLVSLFFVLSFLIFDESMKLHMSSVTIASTWGMLIWFALSYSFFFDILRSHEYEADAYAVLNLGASSEALMSALDKLTTPGEDVPEYVKNKQLPKKSRLHFLTKFFSTHPSLEERKKMLEFKIIRGLSFDYYISLPHKLRQVFKYAFNWKFIG